MILCLLLSVVKRLINDPAKTVSKDTLVIGVWDFMSISSNFIGILTLDIKAILTKLVYLSGNFLPIKFL